jgi:NAD(P)-dependent dehydrogenase (short-subunit alcohol dehydrogenase family)
MSSLGRLGTADEVAAAALFLTSDEAANRLQSGQRIGTIA